MSYTREVITAAALRPGDKIEPGIYAAVFTVDTVDTYQSEDGYPRIKVTHASSSVQPRIYEDFEVLTVRRPDPEVPPWLRIAGYGALGALAVAIPFTYWWYVL